MDAVLEAIRASLKAKTDERAAATLAQTTLIEKAKGEARSLTETETLEFRLKTDAKVAFDVELDNLRASEISRLDEIARDERQATFTAATVNKGEERKVGGVTVLTEERTYNPEASASFFKDVYRMQVSSDFQARDRLERNLKEAITEREFRTRVGVTETRAVGTPGVASLVIPAYLTEQAALVLRKGRPFANLCQSAQIPAEGMSLIIPRGTTGASAAVQNGQNVTISNTDEVWADLTVPVVTIAGEQDVSRQLLERGTAGIDRIIYTDLVRAYAAELDRNTLYGSGAAGEMLGALQTAGIFAATVLGAAPTPTNVFLKIAGQIGAIAGAGAGFAAGVMVMNPRRWAWLTAQMDTTGRPLVNLLAGNYNAYGLNLAPGAYSGSQEGPGYKTVGEVQGLPIVTDGNMPINVGANAEDLIGIFDTSNLLLWEDGDGMPRELRFDQTKGTTLTSLLAVYGYAAFTAARYPTAVGKVGGLDLVANPTWGLTAPTF
jgi:HK97 family phage major capsid protein